MNLYQSEQIPFPSITLVPDVSQAYNVDLADTVPNRAEYTTSSPSLGPKSWSTIKSGRLWKELFLLLDLPYI